LKSQATFSCVTYQIFSIFPTYQSLLVGAFMLIDFGVTFCGLLDEEPRYLLVCVTYQIAHLPISYLPIDL
jgi:hypothetical protein